MKAVLYICHGSRVKQANEQAEAFIRSCIEGYPAPIQEIGFLELAKPTIEQAFETCVNKGATEVIAIPVLLLSAFHAKIDIPNELRRLSELYPEIQINYGRPIGAHPAIIDILLDNIFEKLDEIPTDSKLLLVARGSSDPDIKNELTSIASMLSERTQGKKADICYLAAATPSLEEALLPAETNKNENLIVLPYLLFSGKLMKKINTTLENRAQDQKSLQAITLCGNLGFHPFFKKIIYDRIAEAAVGTSL